MQSPTYFGLPTQVERLYLTNAGHHLREHDPDTLHTFMEAGVELADLSGDKSSYAFIGNGTLCHVYELPENPSLCIKVATEATKDYRSRFSTVPNLLHESGFMDKAQQHLANRVEHGVKAPVQYGAIALSGARSVMLQERPIGFDSVCNLLPADQVDERIAQSRQAAHRADQAFKGSNLRLGIGDIWSHKDHPNWGNFLLQPNTLADGEIYVIDLIGASVRRRAAAMVLAKLP